MQLALLDVTVEYCAVWHYTARAVSLTDEILSEREIEVFVRSWELLPASGGRFEVTVNGELVFSKKAAGRHAQPGEIRALILQKVEAVRPPGFVVHKEED